MTSACRCGRRGGMRFLRKSSCATGRRADPAMCGYSGQPRDSVVSRIRAGYLPVRRRRIAAHPECVPAQRRLRAGAGTVRLFWRSVSTATKLYQMNNTTFTWTDVSKGGGSYSSVPTGDQWQFAQFNNFVFAVQINTVPQVFDLTSSTAFADLGGSPPQARYIAVVNRFVVLSGLGSSTPYRVQWSGLNAPRPGLRV